MTSYSSVPANGWWNYKPMLIAVIVIGVLALILTGLTIAFIVHKVKAKKERSKSHNRKIVDLEKSISTLSVSDFEEKLSENDMISFTTPKRSSSEFRSSLVDQIAQGKMIFGSHKNLNKHINIKHEPSSIELDDPFLDTTPTHNIMPILKQSPVKRTRIVPSFSSSSGNSSLGLSSALKDSSSPASSISVEHTVLSSPRQKKRPELWLEDKSLYNSTHETSDNHFVHDSLTSNHFVRESLPNNGFGHLTTPSNDDRLRSILSTPLTPRSPADSTHILSVERVVMSELVREPTLVTPLPNIIYGQALTSDKVFSPPASPPASPAPKIQYRNTVDSFTFSINDEPIVRSKTGVLMESFKFPQESKKVKEQNYDQDSVYSFEEKHPYDVELEIISSFHN